MINEKHPEDIIIDLKQIQQNNNTLTSRNEFIHRDQLDTVCKILKEKIQLAYNYDPNQKDGFISQNDVVSILARRGAGKTTFVKSLVHLIRMSNDQIFIDLRKDLLCIDVFEPNQIQNKENLLIRFLAHINEMFREKAESLTPSEQYLREQYERATRKLFEALPVIDGVGSGNLFPDWDDTAYIADRYMNLASNVKELEYRLHCYIHTGLRLIGKKALLFILDDSDVNIERSFEILEIIRLYMTSPQIIVMLTGDSTLYGMIIRRKFWNCFDESFLHKECTSFSKDDKKFWEYHKQVYRLEAQYLQKLIKVENRIFLNNIYDKKTINEMKNITERYQIKIKLPKSDVFKEIEDLYRDLLSCFNLVNRIVNVQNIYVFHFLAQPLRNQIRLLSVYDQYLSQKTLQDDNLGELTKGILKVFEIYINQLSGDSKFLMAHSPIYPAWLLKFLIENHILTIGSTFLPEMEDDSLKNAVIALGLSCAEQMKNQSGMIFDYWIRVSLTKQLSLLYGEQILTDKNVNFLNYTNIYTDCGLDTIIGRILAYCNGRPVGDGSLETFGIPGAIIKEGITTDKESYIEVKLIKLLQIESVSSKLNISCVYSLYRPLAILGELLRSTSWNKRPDVFYSLFDQFCQVVCYKEPNANVQSKNTLLSRRKSIENLIINEESCQVEAENERFVEELFNWCVSPIDFGIAPFYIDRIFNRYFDLMLELSNDTDYYKTSLGNFISKAVLALWNAAIIETLIIFNKIPYRFIDRFGGVTKFVDNYIMLTKIDRSLKISSFAFWLIDCPLLKVYVDPFILELLNRIKERKTDDFTDIYSCLRAYLRREKNNHYTKSLEQISKDINEIRTTINRYEEYIDLSHEIHFIDNEISMYESLIKKTQVSFSNKEKYNKTIQDLVEKQNKIRQKRYKLGLNESVKDDEALSELYIKINQLENEEMQIREMIGGINNIEVNDNVLFESIQEKIKNTTSVYSILNHF